MAPANTPDGDSLRVGTAEREDSVRALGNHFAAGRLTLDEYEQRVTAALNAATRGDLRALFADLPAPHPPFLIPPVWALPPPPPYPAPLPHQQHYHPPTHPFRSPKSKVVAGVLQIAIPFGAGRFYTGHYGLAVAQLLTCGGFGIWCFIDGLLLLLNGGTDAQGRPLAD